MPAPLLYAVGISGASALNYGSRLLATDPKLIGENASRYFTGNPSSNLDQAPRFWTDKQSESSAKVSQKQQFQQLSDARYQRSLGNQTGFDDEDDNTIDDRARSKLESQQRAIKAINRDKNSSKGTDTMATPNNRNSRSATTTQTPPISDRYKVDTDAAVNSRNNSMQSSDRRYNTDKTSDVNLKLGSQRNQVDYMVGMDRNAVTRDVGKYTSDNNLKASNFKTYADLQAALNRNRLQSGDNRFETATKYGTQERINAFNRNTLDQTEIATAQIKAGTYGMSRQSQAKAANDKINFDNWKRQNDANFDYADRMNAQIRLGQQIGQANRAYSDQRIDRINDQAAAHSRYQIEMNQKAIARQDNLDQQRAAREQQRADFNLRSQQVQQQINQSQADFQLRSQLANAQIFQIRNDANLKTQQFAATRADVGYNRSQQGRSRSNLAF